MPAWSFRSRFRAALSNGLSQAAGDPPAYPGIRPKRQTIRAERRDGRDPEPGVEMRIWLDMRTPGRVFLGETPPISRVTLRIADWDHVEVDGRLLNRAWQVRLARADGFEHDVEFLEFLEADHGFPFVGFRFRW
jgi:hypothetical protein